tara:strand:+ start:10229 stop:10606 length:378 start_codon:yes stop_codon:yes gene_type:complete
MSKKKEKKKPSSDKRKKIKVSLDNPYYSSEPLRKGFDQRLASALHTEDMRKSSPLGDKSIKAGLTEGLYNLTDLTRPEEGQVGARLAKKLVQEAKKKDKQSGFKKGGSLKKGFLGKGAGVALRGF